MTAYTTGPPIEWNLTVWAGSWGPAAYIVLRDPDSGDPIDLTQPGYLVRGVVATRPDGRGTVLAELDEPVWRRTAQGHIFFEPLPALTSTWTWRVGWHQVEITNPDVSKPVRVAAGRFRVIPELVKEA